MLKKIICLLFAFLMAMLIIGCTPQNGDDQVGESKQQETEDVTLPESKSNEEETTNAAEHPTDTAESTGSDNSDGWTGIY